MTAFFMLVIARSHALLVILNVVFYCDSNKRRSEELLSQLFAPFRMTRELEFLFLILRVNDDCSLLLPLNNFRHQKISIGSLWRILERFFG
jgi:hypothetical protein